MRMKKGVLTILLSFGVLAAPEGQSSYAKASAGQADDLAVKIVNNNNPVIQLHAQQDPCSCQPYFGAEFKKCMAYKSKDCFKKNMQALDERVSATYAHDLSIDEIKKIRASFNEAEWKELKSLNPYFIGTLELMLKKFEASNRIGLKEFCGCAFLGILYLVSSS